MASPKIYKWTDTSAPQIKRGNTADYQNLFQKVLVDGYGTKTAAGWTIPFADASGFIIKQGGTGGVKACLKFYDFSAGGYNCKMQAADNYTDYNTPVNQFAGLTTADRLVVGYANPTYHIPWIIFATATTIYMMFGYNNTQTNSAQFVTITTTATQFHNYHNFFGNYNVYNSSDVRKQLVIYPSLTSTQPSQICNALTSPTAQYSTKKINSISGGIIGSFNASYLMLKEQNIGAITVGGNSANSPVFPNPNDGSLYLDTPKLMANKSIIGYMAGMLYSPSYKAFPITNDIYSFNGSGSYAGQKIYVINTNDGQFYIHDGDWGVE